MALLAALLAGSPARADRKPPTASIANPSPSAAPERHKVAPRSTEGRTDGKPESSGGWWWSTAGVALILALAGWGSYAGRKFLPKTVANTKGLKVVGRTSLSPRHSVYLLQVGERVLLVGTGPNGAPSLLGELPPVDPSTRFDHRIGDDDA